MGSFQISDAITNEPIKEGEKVFVISLLQTEMEYSIILEPDTLFFPVSLPKKATYNGQADFSFEKTIINNIFEKNAALMVIKEETIKKIALTEKEAKKEINQIIKDMLSNEENESMFDLLTQTLLSYTNLTDWIYLSNKLKENAKELIKDKDFSQSVFYMMSLYFWFSKKGLCFLPSRYATDSPLISSID